MIDGGVTGNSSRWINHACAPNCEADEVDGRVFIQSCATSRWASQLFYDYGLIDERHAQAASSARRCGTS